MIRDYIQNVNRCGVDAFQTTVSRSKCTGHVMCTSICMKQLGISVISDTFKFLIPF